MTATMEPIVDSHHHLWDTVNNPYPWLVPQPPGAPIGVMGDLAGLPRPFLIEDYESRAQALGIVKSVHVEALWGGDPVEETRWVQAVADGHPFPNAIVGAADLSDPAVGEVFDRHLESANVRSVRQCLNWHEDPGKRFCERGELMLDAGWRRGFAELEPRGLSFDLYCNSVQLPEAVELARAFPGTAIVLEHTGTPFDRDEAGLAAWKSGMRGMAGEPNVSLKLSGLGMTDHHWTTDSVRPFFLESIELFGPDRCMFASNVPADLLYATFERIVESFREIIADFSAAERASMLSETATRVYRI